MVYRHLSHALRIMRQEPDFTKWGPLIDQLTPEEQAEVRPWLRDRARIALYRRQATSASRPAASPASTNKQRTTSRTRRAAAT